MRRTRGIESCLEELLARGLSSQELVPPLAVGVGRVAHGARRGLFSSYIAHPVSRSEPLWCAHGSLLDKKH